MATKTWVVLWLLSACVIAVSAVAADENTSQLTAEQLEVIVKTLGNKTWVEKFLSDYGSKGLEGEGSAPFSIELNVVDVELHAGESKEYSLTVVNIEETLLLVRIYPSGGFSEFIHLEENIFQIPPGGSRPVKFTMSIPKATTIGVYSGKLYVRSPDWVEGVAMDIKVIPSEKPILEAKVTAITKDLEPGKDLVLLVEVYNQGRSGRMTLDITHKIVNAKTDEVVARVSEPYNLTTSLLYQKKIPLEDTGVGRYVAEVSMSYTGGVISSSDYFSIKRPLPVNLIASIFGLGVLAFSALKTKNYYKKLKLEKSRYVPVVDEKEFPKKGEDSVFLGKLADMDMDTYLSLEDLLTHVLIAGGTGYGKSVAAMDIAEGALEQGIPVIVVDPTLQWTGFLNPCEDEEMLKLYADFGMKREDARRFKGTVIEIAKSGARIDLPEYIKPGEITVLGLNNLQPDEIDASVATVIASILNANLEVSDKLNCLLVFDEVHRLLPKYGGKQAYSQLENAMREFRRWGIGMMLVSQVLSDFKSAVHGNIATEIQMKTKFAGDMARIEQKYGEAYSRTLVKEPVGVGMIQNSKYNGGLPYFVKFRPLLHSTLRMSEEELNEYQELLTLKKTASSKIQKMAEGGGDTQGLEFELKLGIDKLKEGQHNLAKIYLTTLNEKLEAGGGAGA